MLYDISRAILEVLLKIFFRIRIFGKKNLPDPPYILAPNHASLLDPPLVGIACKKDHVDFMAKKELFDIPVAGAWCRGVGCISVERGGIAVRSLKEAIKRLEKKRVVCIFPEGERSVEGSLQEAKRGTGFLIARAGVPVVPVYVKGSGEALPKEGKIKPGTRIDISIGKPIAGEEFSVYANKRKYELIALEVMSRIARLKESRSRESGENT